MPQTVRVTGIDDGLADGNQPIAITIGSGVSGDPLYSGQFQTTLNGLVLDNAVKPDVSIVGPTPNDTNEDGSSVTFSVQLTTQPAANVTLNLRSDDATEGIVTPSRVVFTSTNWNTPQAVTVTGLDDEIDDGDIAYNVITDQLISGDPRYSAINPKDIALVNVDDDTRGITIAPATGLSTTESGGTDSFHVALTSQPTAPVRVILVNNTPDEVKFSPTSVVLTPGTPAAGSPAGTARWDIGVDVTVTGVDDQLLDGNQNWTIHTDPLQSADPAYDGVNPVEITGVNQDDDAAGITVNPTFLVVTEGKSTTFTVVLNAKPTADVTLSLSVNDATEVILGKKQLVFTSANFNVPQSVVISGINDQILDGNQPFAVTIGPAVSSDTAYNALAAEIVNGTVLDIAARPAVTVSAPSPAQTTEAGVAATFTVVLTTQPTSNVVLNLRSRDTTEGVVTPGRLTFTPINFDTPQVVTVTGVDDSIDDGNVPYIVELDPVISSDPNYSTINPKDVALVNVDDDTRGVVIDPISGLITTEAGGKATFNVTLASRPAGNVTLDLSTSNSDEITFSPARIIFTPDNPPAGSPSNMVRWDRGKIVTVKGVDDQLLDGDRPWTIVTAPLDSPSDPLYNGLNPPNVTGINQDNDSAGITVTPQFIVVPEGKSTNITAVLNTKPTANVTVPLSVNDATEVNLSKTQLVFTSANYNVPQTITVTGINDGVADGNQPFAVTFGPTVSSDPAYNALPTKVVNGTCIDVAVTPAITVTPPGSNQTTEGGGSVTFSVVLTTQPTNNVTINVQSNDPTEGIVTPGTLTFTPFNFNTPQAVTVTGLDDAIDDGNIPYQVVIDPAISSDTNYNNLNPADIALVNVDDDTRGITIVPATGLTTTETGGTDIFHVALTSQPKGNVVLTLVNNTPSEVKLSLTTITLTPQAPGAGSAAGTARWDIGVDVTVTGVDDQLLDGNQNWTIHTDPLQSADPAYNGVNPVEITGVNQDDDAAGITVNPTFLVVTEGKSTTFTVVLNAKPTADVTLSLSVNDATEVILGKKQLVFTSANFNVPQSVVISGINDQILDGNQPFAVTIGPAVSSDTAYNALAAEIVNGTVLDIAARPAVTVSAPSPAQTTEAGVAATFTVVLTTQPTSNVVLNLRSRDTTEGVVTPGRLTFTPINFDTPQVVTVTGVDDSIDDGNVPYIVELDPVISSDPNYSTINPKDVALVNVDDDTRGVVIDPISGLITTEAGGKATFNVTLASRPAGNVTLDLSTSNSDEITFSPARIIFTPDNPPAGSPSNMVRWDRGKIVTVTGVDDALNDGSQPWTIVTAPLVSPADPGYAGINPPNVTGVNQDNEAPGVTVRPQFVLVSEGSSTTFTVVLNSKPTTQVVLPLSINTTTEAILDKTQLVFTPANYNVPQTVRVTGIDDGLADGNQPIAITIGSGVSGDPLYSGQFQTTLNGLVLDNAVKPDVSIVGPTPNDTNEDGSSVTFSVQLTTQPAASVTLNLRSDDATEGIVTPSRVVFTSTNWNTPQAVTVTGLDDEIDDGDIAYNVITDQLISGDPRYSAINPKNIALVNVDDDTRGITIAPATGLSTTESGGTDSFHVALTSQPTAPVRVILVNNTPDEVKFSPTSVVLTPGTPAAGSPAGTARWDIGVDVTVTGVDDQLLDGNQNWTIHTDPLQSADAAYNGVNPVEITGVNQDDDAAGITVNPTFLIVAEGTSTTFTVVLNTKPDFNVLLPLNVVNNTTTNNPEVMVDKSQLVFTPANFNVPQTVRVTGINDGLKDGDQPFQITIGAPLSSDPDYRSLAQITVDGICRDLGVRPGITVSNVDVTQTSEKGDAATFSVVLNTQPSAVVRLNLRSTDTSEGVVTPARLTFNSLNFNIPQVVTVTGRDDKIDDGNIPYQVITEPAISQDPNYNLAAARDFNLTNVDDDIRGVTVTPSSGLVTTEAGGKATFNVRLDTQPSDIVTLNLSTNNTDEITFNPSQITFTRDDPPAGSASNVVRWDRGKTVTVTGEDDALNDGSQPWVIVTAPLSSADPLYSGFNPANVTGINQDDETPNLIVSPRIPVTTEGQSTQFTARLTVKPSANVRFALSVNDASEVSLSQNFLLFTPTDYNQPHTINLNGVPDFVRDGDQPFVLTIAAAVSSDPIYNGKFGASLTGTNIDVDIPGITVSPSRSLVTTEVGGIDEFTVVLNSRPKPNTVVVLKVASSDTTEGRIILPSAGTLTFDETNFNIPQTVRVRGVDDLIEDGDQPYQIILNVDTTAANADTDYDFVSLAPIAALNIDNEKPGIKLTPITDLTSTEAGGAVVIDVTLNSPPTAAVTVTLKSSDTSEGRLVDPATRQTDINNAIVLTFTAANFNTPQRVTVRGMDDSIADGDIPYDLRVFASSNDSRYDTLVVTPAKLINLDDDVAGITITPITGLAVSEAGTTDTFTVSLKTQPTAPVTLTLQSSDEGEATLVNLTTIIFTPDTPTQSNTESTRFARWDQPVTVTVRGVRDNLRDGDQTFSIITNQLTGSDSRYNRINPPDVRGTTRDIDIPDVVVIPIPATIRTLEGAEQSGVTSKLRIRLNTKPKFNVSLSISVSDLTEARVDTAKLTFTPEDPTQEDTFAERFVRWDNPGPDPQHLLREPTLVNIIGVDDKVEDGDVPYQVILGPTTSLDADYKGIDPQDLQGVTVDDDDRTRPIIAITSPVEGASLNALSTITGTAVDPASTATGVSSGIKMVQVRIFRTGFGYYNGNTGSFDETYNPAVHLLTASYDAQSTVWTLNIPKLTAASPSLPSGQYFAVATATDNADQTVGNDSNVRSTERRNFSIDATAPTEDQVVITSPVDQGVYTTLSEATGTATDNTGGSGIKRVRVLVFRYENAATPETEAGYLLADGSFSSTSTAANLLETSGTTTNGKFNFRFLFTPPLTAGRYFIQAKADDNAGNSTFSTRVLFTIRNTASGPDDFLAGQTYLISVPYMDSSTANATTTVDQAFNLTTFDSFGTQRFQLNRRDATTGQYVLLGPNDILKRGEGYFLKPLTDMRILRPSDDPTRVAMDPNITQFTVTLRRNASADDSDPFNGFNLIGDPFNPETFIGANWVDANVIYNGKTYPDVASAAADGIIDSRLFVLNAAGGYDPVTTNMEPFKGYFVKTFADGVQVVLTAVSAIP